MTKNCYDYLEQTPDQETIVNNECKDYLEKFCKTNTSKPYCRAMVDNYCHPCMHYLNHTKDVEQDCIPLLKKLCNEPRYKHYTYCVSLREKQGTLYHDCNILDTTNLIVISCIMLIIFILLSAKIMVSFNM